MVDLGCFEAVFVERRLFLGGLLGTPPPLYFLGSFTLIWKRIVATSSIAVTNMNVWLYETLLRSSPVSIGPEA